MFRNGSNNWLTICTGIEIHVLPDNSISCRYCNISLNKNALTISDKGILEGTPQASINKIPDKINPVTLVLTGKGVLVKKTSRIDLVNSEIIARLFPGAKEQQFYIQHYISGDQSYISLVRREQADELLKLFYDAGFKVLSVSLGPFVAAHVLQQLNLYGNEVIFDGHVITLKDRHWDNYQYKGEECARFPVKIDIEVIPEKNIISYSAAFQLALYKQVNVVKIDTEVTSGVLSEYIQERIFKARWIYILSVSFIALLINFLLFNYYNSLNSSLVERASHNTSSLSDTKKLEAEVKQKELLMKDLGWTGIRHAFILDQIGQSVPSRIMLNALNINYESRLLADNIKPRDTGAEIIKISGVTTEVQAVNNWIYLLRDKNWIKDVTLDQFKPDPETGLQSFTIVISY